MDLSPRFLPQQEQTRKTHNPDLPAVRSGDDGGGENSANGSNGGVPGALSNQPPAASSIPEQAAGGEGGTSSSGRSRKGGDPQLRTGHHREPHPAPAGGIRRMTVSVAVDYKAVPGADGAVTREARSQAELDTLRRLLSGGLGFDVTRGDTLEVVAIPVQPSGAGSRRRDAALRAALVLARGAHRRLGAGHHSAHRHRGKAHAQAPALPGCQAGRGAGLRQPHRAGWDDELSLLAAQAEAEPVFGLQDGQLKLPDLHRDEDLLKAVARPW